MKISKYSSIVFLGTAIFLIQASHASDQMSLEQLLASPDPVKALNDLKAKAPDAHQRLCAAIKDNSFYEAAKAAGIGTIKQTKIINACVGVTYRQSVMQKVTQGEKPKEAAKEVIKLKPVDLSKKGNVQDEQAALEAARKVILENAEMLGQKAEIEAKLETTQKQIAEAKESYDNLGVLISFMRDDLKEITQFKVFKPKEHDKDTPEQYLEALSGALSKGDKAIFTSKENEQLSAAYTLLKQANENLAKARGDLERINRELLEKTH